MTTPLVIDQELLGKVEQFVIDFEQMKQQYVARSELLQFKNRYEAAAIKVKALDQRAFIAHPIFVEFNKTYERLKPLIDQHNEKFVRKEIQAANYLLSNIDGKALDRQQNGRLMRKLVSTAVRFMAMRNPSNLNLLTPQDIDISCEELIKGEKLIKQTNQTHIGFNYR